MTIVTKWRQMLSYFADIRSAIIEMGGTVGNGYSSYANAIRKIYKGAAVGECSYPQKADNATDNALNLVRWCKSIKEQIRQAIIAGGVSCVEDVPLSEYGNKIRSIVIFDFTVQGLSGDTVVLPKGEAGTEYNAQITVLDNTGADITNRCTFEIISGSRPGGMTIQNGGVVNIPAEKNTRSGTFASISIRITDTTMNMRKTFNFYLSIDLEHITLKILKSSFTYDGQPHTAEAAYFDRNGNRLENFVPSLSYYSGGTYLKEVTEIGSYSISYSRYVNDPEQSSKMYEVIYEGSQFLWIN